MSNIKEKLTAFQMATLEKPFYYPVISTVSGALTLTMRVCQFALGLIGTVFFTVGGAFSEKSRDLKDRSAMHVKDGLIGGGIAIIQMIPFGPFVIRIFGEAIGVSIKG